MEFCSKKKFPLSLFQEYLQLSNHNQHLLDTFNNKQHIPIKYF